MTRLHAVDYEAGRALFEVSGQFVVIDTQARDVSAVADSLTSLTAGASWLKVAADFSVPQAWRDLADAAVTKLDVSVSESSGSERRFKVPVAVKMEASKSLSWATEFGRGRSTAGERVAEQLATAEYVTLSDVKRLNVFFGRIGHDGDALGWAPGQQGYPVDDRIRYGMRGGTAARQWASKIASKFPSSTDDTAQPADTAGGAGNVNHPFAPDPTDALICIICGRPEDDDIHQPEDGALDDSIDGDTGAQDPDLDGDDDTSDVGDTDSDASGGAGEDAGLADDSLFEPDPAATYFGVGTGDPNSTVAAALLMQDADGNWSQWDSGSWVDTAEPAGDANIIMLDPDSAKELADWLDNTPPDQQADGLELSMLNPHEAALFALAEADMDWEMVDSVASLCDTFDIYDTQERSVNAKKQLRAPGGRFGETGADGGESANPAPKARLAEPMPLVQDVGALINSFEQSIAETGGQAAPDSAPVQTDFSIATFADGASGAASAAPATGTQPLYLAIVDGVDTQAVLDLVALMPAQPLTAWKRDNGQWVQAPDVLSQLQGSNPPPVVQLTDPTQINDVVQQVDASTSGGNPDAETPAAPGSTDQAPNGTPATTANPAANPDNQPTYAVWTDEFGGLDAAELSALSRRGYALPDGSYPIRSVSDLKSAYAAFGLAKNEDLVRQHITKRAYALRRLDVVPRDWRTLGENSAPEMWGPHGEIISLTATAGKELTPEDARNTERLREYWTHGEGAAKIGGWGRPGDFDSCVRHLAKYLHSLDRTKGYCALRHRDATGFWPGHAPTEQDGKHGH